MDEMPPTPDAENDLENSIENAGLGSMPLPPLDPANLDYIPESHNILPPELVMDQMNALNKQNSYNNGNSGGGWNIVGNEEEMMNAGLMNDEEDKLIDQHRNNAVKSNGNPVDLPKPNFMENNGGNNNFRGNYRGNYRGNNNRGNYRNNHNIPYRNNNNQNMGNPVENKPHVKMPLLDEVPPPELQKNFNNSNRGHNNRHGNNSGPLQPPRNGPRHYNDANAGESNLPPPSFGRRSTTPPLNGGNDEFYKNHEFHPFPDDGGEAQAPPNQSYTWVFKEW